MNTSKINTEQIDLPTGNKVSGNRVLLALLPFWTPLIPPQGISRIKGFLQKHGYHVKALDANLERNFKQLYDRYFNTLREYVPVHRRGNFYNIGNDVWREHMMAHINYVDEKEYLELVKILVYKIFYIDISETQVLRLNEILTEFYAELERYMIHWLDREKPDVLGISVYRDTLPATVFAFRLTREKYPHIKTVMGGGIFSIQLTPGSPNLESFMERTADFIDKIFIGEGENLLLKFLEGELPEDQRFFTLKDIGGKRIGFAPLEQFDYSDFDGWEYQYQAAQASGSCPNRCSFCNVLTFYGDYKEKEPGRIVEEMTRLYRRYGSQLFHMMDSLVNNVGVSLAEAFIKSDICLYWDGYFRVEADMDRDKAMLLRRGGFYRARMGVESGSQHVLDLMEKGITVEQTKNTLAHLAQSGIKTTTYIVIGHPGETEADFQKTLDLVEECKDYIWEAECNPFTYFYNGQGGSNEWAAKRSLVYPESAKDMLICQTWFVDNGLPTREELYDRVFRFVEHCKKLGINTPWSLHDVNKQDRRWIRLHKNAVPPVMDLINKNLYLDECKRVTDVYLARGPEEDDEEFDF